jgi:ketosteroid isomerase-like protein
MVPVLASTTETVLAHHLQAFMARDLAALTEDYAEDAIILTNLAQQPVQGLPAIGAFFAQALPTFTPELIAAVQVARQEVVGEFAYLVWSALPAITFATDTFVIKDGKIRLQTGAVATAAAG